MNVTQDLSILHLILQASAIVQIVMGILVWISFTSCYYISIKWFAVRDARRKTEKFERDFWSGGDLSSLYNRALNRSYHAGSM
ncbi:MAG: protein TolQ, partial [Zoogloeaceae bacterium]|nr:protein TolQ [Zoogloeaceae bacterium]